MGEHRIEPWDRYWAYGNVHSFSQVAGGNYQGTVAEFWRARFAPLAAHSRVLDIATGNGAIALLALQAGDEAGRPLEVHGVDLAAIDPQTRVSDPALSAALARIQFRGRVAAESLPFDDAHFDLVCSQFGLEYSDLSRAVPELARVLAPGGRCAAIMHHHESILLQATREELAQLDFVLGEVKLFLRARNVLRAMDGAGPGRRRGAAVEKKQRALENAMAQVNQAAARRRQANMLLGPARYIREIFSALPATPPRELLDWLEEARRRVIANQCRLQDMLAAARRESDLEVLHGLLEASGLAQIETAALRREDGALIGWRVAARRPAADEYRAP